MTPAEIWTYIISSLTYMSVMAPLGHVLWSWLEDIDYVFE